MRVTAKFGITAADALRLVREARRILVFVGREDDGDNRFLMEVSRASLIRDLKRVPADRGRQCYLDVDDEALYFGSYRATRHVKRVSEFNARRAASAVAP